MLFGYSIVDVYPNIFFRCVDTRTNTQVKEEMCDWTTQPADINACHLACPGDCVLSPWSEWSICPKVSKILLMQ